MVHKGVSQAQTGVIFNFTPYINNGFIDMIFLVKYDAIFVLDNLDVK